jgi:hypothetical protein
VRKTGLHFLPEHSAACGLFRTAVSLHGHTRLAEYRPMQSALRLALAERKEMAIGTRSLFS